MMKQEKHPGADGGMVAAMEASVAKKQMAHKHGKKNKKPGWLMPKGKK